MTQDVRDLIAEAREAMTERDDTGWFWVGRLVDALEAATRQPSEGEYILKLIESVKGSRSSVEIDGVKIMPCDEYGRTGVERDAAVAAIERVRAIHRSEPTNGYNGQVRYECLACGITSPCPTIMAVEGDE